MEGASGVTQSIINPLHSSYNQGDQMECESGFTRRMIDEFHS